MAGALGDGGDEDLRRGDDLRAGGVVLADPGLVPAELVEVHDEVEVALDRQRRVLAGLVERRHEDAEAQSVGHVVTPWLMPRRQCRRRNRTERPAAPGRRRGAPPGRRRRAPGSRRSSGGRRASRPDDRRVAPGWRRSAAPHSAAARRGAWRSGGPSRRAPTRLTSPDTVHGPAASSVQCVGREPVDAGPGPDADGLLVRSRRRLVDEDRRAGIGSDRERGTVDHVCATEAGAGVATARTAAPARRRCRHGRRGSPTGRRRRGRTSTVSPAASTSARARPTSPRPSVPIARTRSPPSVSSTAASGRIAEQSVEQFACRARRRCRSVSTPMAAYPGRPASWIDVAQPADSTTSSVIARPSRTAPTSPARPARRVRASGSHRASVE